MYREHHQFPFASWSTPGAWPKWEKPRYFGQNLRTGRRPGQSLGCVGWDGGELGAWWAHLKWIESTEVTCHLGFTWGWLLIDLRLFWPLLVFCLSVLEIHRQEQRGLANSVTYGCMLDACVKCGNLEKAVEVFRGMRALDIGCGRCWLVASKKIQKATAKSFEAFVEAAFDTWSNDGLDSGTGCMNTHCKRIGCKWEDGSLHQKQGAF